MKKKLANLLFVFTMFASIGTIFGQSQITATCDRDYQTGQLYNCRTINEAVVYPSEPRMYNPYYPQQPAYVNQRQRTVVQNIDGGFDGRRPWITYSATIVHSNVRVSTNTGGYNAQVMLAPMYYPDYRRNNRSYYPNYGGGRRIYDPYVYNGGYNNGGSYGRRIYDPYGGYYDPYYSQRNQDYSIRGGRFDLYYRNPRNNCNCRPPGWSR